MTPRPGDRLGPWTLEAPIASGGIATVWRARGARGGRVALKVLRSADDEVDIRRLARERESLRRLQHPNIVRLLDHGIQSGIHWLALELVEGPDLAAWLEDHPGPCRDLAWVVRLTHQLADALAYIHRHGLVHRDIKPSNILLAPDGRARLTDFGIVKGQGMFDTSLTAAGRFVGTLAWLSPEQITGEAVDARSDLYALGAVLYRLLTGRRPFEADSVAGFLALQLTRDPLPPTHLVPGIPEHLDALCRRLLAKDPAERFQRAEEVMAALRSSPAPPPPRLHARGRAIRQAEEALAGLAAGQVATLAVLGPRGSGRSRFLEVLETLARRRGLPVARRPDEAPPGGLLLVDDLDRAPDPLVARVLELAGEATPPRLVAFSAVADLGARVPASPQLRARLPLLPMEPIVLAPFARGELQDFLRQQGLGAPTAALLARRLLEATAGLPGPLVQHLDALVGDGWLRRSDDGRLTPALPPGRLRTRPLPVPPALRATLLAELQACNAVEREVLLALAAIDGRSDPELVDQVVPGGRMALARLHERGWLGLRGRSPGGGAFLLRPRARDVLLATLDPAQRQALHRRVADVLLRRHAQRPGAMAEHIAHHLHRAGRDQEARTWYQLAANWWSRRNHPERVLAVIRAARTVGGPPDPEHARTLAALEAAAWCALHRHDRVEAALAGTDLLEAIHPDDRASVQAGLAWAQAQMAAHRPGRAVPLLRSLHASLAPGDPVRPWAERLLAAALLEGGETERAEAVLAAGLERGRSAGARAWPALHEIALARVLAVEGRLDAAATALDRGLHGLRAQDHAAHAEAHLLAAELALVDARYAQAIEEAERVATAAARGRLPRAALQARLVAAEALDALGRAEVAAQLRAEAEEWLQSPGDRNWPRAAHAIREGIARAGRLPPPARREAVASLLERIPDPGGRALRLEALLACGADATFRERARTLLDRIDREIDPADRPAFRRRWEARMASPGGDRGSA